MIGGRGGELARRDDRDAGIVRTPVADGRAVAAPRRTLVRYPAGGSSAPVAHGQAGGEEAGRACWYSEGSGVAVIGSRSAPAERAGMGGALVFAVVVVVRLVFQCFGAR